MKINASSTYYYPNFITEDERLTIKDWALRNEDYLEFNPTGPFRARQFFELIPEKLKLLQEIKDRIIGIEELSKEEYFSFRGDFVSIHRNGGQVPEHIDINPEDTTFYSRRYNVFISLPEEGGLPVYEDIVIKLEEKCLLKVDAGIVKHSTTKINGNTPRIMLSYGFAFKK